MPICVIAAVECQQGCGAAPNVAAALCRGEVGEEHVRIIRRFFDRLPAVVDMPTREATERQLAQMAAEHDHRTSAQRSHDALRACLRGTLASGDLGSHHGLPVTVVVTTTLT
ncbi:hypothetical protein MSTE_03776 [Mycobacteroides stephanolepidis]|uniref:DUF222 domain-containing protein n=1 Tax=[Mycobacterium] stephanolepidis TaxID=1520670 RepID=A0A1Z4F1M9_9MYCO|nr:hypothetical protein MSTE_03776 [[Mycobacterium] stephanolepidis]